MIESNTSRCHFDEMMTGHWKVALVSFCQSSHILACFSRSSCGWTAFLCLGPPIQGMQGASALPEFRSASFPCNPLTASASLSPVYMTTTSATQNQDVGNVTQEPVQQLTALFLQILEKISPSQVSNANGQSAVSLNLPTFSVPNRINMVIKIFLSLARNYGII